VVCERDVWSSSTFDATASPSPNPFFLLDSTSLGSGTSRRFRAAAKPRLAAHCSLANYVPPLPPSLPPSLPPPFSFLFSPFTSFYSLLYPQDVQRAEDDRAKEAAISNLDLDASPLRGGLILRRGRRRRRISGR